jgi:hypothetical protein
VEVSGSAVIKCSYELCVEVVSKSNIKFKTPLTVSITRGSIIKLPAIGCRKMRNKNCFGGRKSREDPLFED